MREMNHCGLGRGVRVRTEARDEAGGARDVDDIAAFTRLHHACRMLGAEEHAALNNCVSVIPFGERQRGDGAHHADNRGVIDQAIELTPGV